MSILGQIVEQENHFLHFDSVVEYEKNKDGKTQGIIKSNDYQGASSGGRVGAGTNNNN